MIKNTFNGCIQKFTINKFHPDNLYNCLHANKNLHDLNQLNKLDIFIFRKYFIRSDISKFFEKKIGGYNFSRKVNCKSIYKATHIKDGFYNNFKKLKEFNKLFNNMFLNFVYVCKCVSICTFDFEKKILQKLLRILKLKAHIISYEIVKLFYINYFELLRFERTQQIEGQIRILEKCKECEDNIKKTIIKIKTSESMLENYFNHFEFHFKDYYLSAKNLQKNNN